MVTVVLRGRATGQFAAMIGAKLAGLDIAAPAPSAAPVSGPVDLVLAVAGGQVRLAGGGAEVSAGHGGGPPRVTAGGAQSPPGPGPPRMSRPGPAAGPPAAGGRAPRAGPAPAGAGWRAP